MNNNTKLLILSDVHLERINKVKKNFLLSTINEKIENLKNNGFESIVIFAGDIDNSISGYDFISKVNTNCIYVAGNHEFWGHDYYETLNELQSKAPPNVKFLHNDVTSIGEYLFLGTTLWTDAGYNLNKDLVKFAASRMNDMLYIFAKEWYKDKSNINRLKEIYQDHEIKEKIKTGAWNIFTELDENKKSWNFINNSDLILSAINKASLINTKLDQDLNSKYLFPKNTKDTYFKIKEKVDFTKENLTWSQFINNLSTIEGGYSISKKEKNIFLKDESSKESLFQKIRNIKEILNKKIVIITHHLPFYEEILVGGIMKEHARTDVKLFNQTDENIFLIRSGIDYPEADYLYRAISGEIDKFKDITHIVNYCNNGSSKIGPFLLKNTNLWIHGHEHCFRHYEYVKGIKIIANPVNSALSLFNNNSNFLKLDAHYMRHYKIKKNNEPEEINKIKIGLVTESERFLTEKELENSVKLWSIKIFNWNEHLNCLKKIGQAAKKIFLFSIEYLQKEDITNQSIQQHLSEIKENASVWIDSYNYNCLKLTKMHEDLKLACSVRLDKDFSFQSYKTNSLTTFRDIYSWTMGNANPPEQIKEESFGLLSAKISFEAIGNIKIAIKYAEIIQEFFKTVDFKYIYQVKQHHIDSFDNLFKKAIDKQKVAKKISEKWDLFYQKVFEENTNFNKRILAYSTP